MARYLHESIYILINGDFMKYFRFPRKTITWIFLFNALLFSCPLWQNIPVDSTEASLEQRVADIEAYMNNSARATTTAVSPVESKIPGPGPGHNAWMMTSTLLVLFMTLPGLAIFYGGLVRSKNILSIMAQCMGITGLVTILWW